MNIVINYIKESFYEFRYCVQWPKWNKLQILTIIVAVSTFFLSIFLFILDFSFSNLIKILYRNILKIFNY